MDREQQILKEIEEKENLIKKTKDEIFSLNFELHKIEEKKVLKRFNIGDIIVHRDTYLCQLTDIDVSLGYFRTNKMIHLKSNKAYRYDFQPQPIGRLFTFLEFGRLANKEEIERFNKEFKKE
jgi:hypothetical protein